MHAEANPATNLHDETHCGNITSTKPADLMKPVFERPRPVRALGMSACVDVLNATCVNKLLTSMIA